MNTISACQTFSSARFHVIREVALFAINCVCSRLGRHRYFIQVSLVFVQPHGGWRWLPLVLSEVQPGTSTRTVASLEVSIFECPFSKQAELSLPLVRHSINQSEFFPPIFPSEWVRLHCEKSPLQAPIHCACLLVPYPRPQQSLLPFSPADHRLNKLLLQKSLSFRFTSSIGPNLNAISSILLDQGFPFFHHLPASSSLDTRHPTPSAFITFSYRTIAHRLPSVPSPVLIETID